MRKVQTNLEQKLKLEQKILTLRKHIAFESDMDKLKDFAYDLIAQVDLSKNFQSKYKQKRVLSNSLTKTIDSIKVQYLNLISPRTSLALRDPNFITLSTVKGVAKILEDTQLIEYFFKKYFDFFDYTQKSSYYRNNYFITQKTIVCALAKAYKEDRKSLKILNNKTVFEKNNNFWQQFIDKKSKQVQWSKNIMDTISRNILNTL
jgi:hypothetical protein